MQGDCIWDMTIPPPEKSIYYFKAAAKVSFSDRDKLNGNYDISYEQFIHSVRNSLSDNIIHQSTIIRNTGEIIALLLYCGSETKVQLNQGKYTFKQSQTEKKLNIVLFINVILMVCLSALMTGLNHNFLQNRISQLWYIYPDSREINLPAQSLATFATFAILFNRLIPISIAIALEVARFFFFNLVQSDFEMAQFIDNQQKRDFSFTTCKVQNLNLHEELGQVRYILCDKTGTLTQNELIVRDILVCSNLEAQINRCIMLCHKCSLINSTMEQESKYCGESQDEITLLYHLKTQRISQISYRDSQLIEIDMYSSIEKYEILRTFEFTSERKLMSVIVQNLKDQKVYLFIKGADSAVLPFVNESIDKQSVQQMLNIESKKGHRTLVFAMRELFLHKDEDMLEIRESDILNDLIILGASSMEDLLQDSVFDCIQDFMAAGINVWMLTGDKLETSLEIARSCGLITQNEELIELTDDTFQMPAAKFSISICGEYFQKLLHEQTELFSDNILKFASSVVVNRCSPGQKAMITSYVKEKLCKQGTTLAIGDGGNDINMIQTAHIGIGVFGKEGNQAATYSDFAIPKFKALRRLLFWHGRSFGYHLTGYVKMFMFKNMTFGLVQLFQNLKTGFSGSTLFVDFEYGLYDPLMTVVYITNYCAFDQDIPFQVTNIESKLKFKLSQYYRYCRDEIQEKMLFPQYTLFWLPYIILSSAFIYYISESTLCGVSDQSGRITGFISWSSAIYFCLPIMHSMQVLIAFRNHTLWTFAALAFQVVVFFPVSLTLNELTPGSEKYRSMYLEIMSQELFWLVLFFMCSTLLLLKYGLDCYNQLIKAPQYTLIQ
ncbi:hypothetical protein FGO68_gene15596 [Halteria grandinella]|uniref:P-type ATPase C-terminal domain-containing protein n=1 Tax=Halteria grandinella TaxID=5974 RepID=A0A8J8NZ04_HALGN|nr:hypothetical protein FGO68_gene15596 [Halteria grandinella]